MKKQTAVEWLINELIPKDQHEGIMDIIEEAKEIEKQQIIDAYDKGEFNQGCNGNAEQYCNETYGK
jgi:hypothetical protein